MIHDFFKDMFATHVHTDAHVAAHNTTASIDLISISWLRIGHKELIGVPFTESVLTFVILNLLSNDSARTTGVVRKVHAELTDMRCLSCNAVLWSGDQGVPLHFKLLESCSLHASLSILNWFVADRCQHNRLRPCASEPLNLALSQRELA